MRCRDASQALPALPALAGPAPGRSQASLQPLGGAANLAGRRRAGFTLIEVLVALLIMAIMAAMGWQGVASMARSRDIGSAASERTLRLSAVVGQLEQDLAAVYDSPLVPGLSFDGASLRIVRRSDSGVQVVVWSLREGVWRRWTSAPAVRVGDLQQAWLASQQLQGPEPGQLKLIDGVTGWQVYFWRGQGWSNAQSSGTVVAVAGAGPGLALAPGGAASGPGAGEAAGSAAAAAAEAAAAGAAAASGAAPAGTVPATGGAPATVTQRVLLPTGVRLQLDLPEGRLLRDVLLAPQS